MLEPVRRLRSMLNRLRDTLFKGLFRARFRYDVFISYNHRAKGYAVNLKKQLAELDFTCFIDQEESPPGLSLDPTLEKAISKSAILVLLATDRALTRPYIALEFERFVSTGRRIIPINILGALTGNDEEALAKPPWDIIKSRKLIWVDETEEAFAKEIPSPPIADGIDKLFKYTRRNARVRTEIIGTAVMVLLAAVIAGFVIKGQAAEVSKQAGLAEVAKKETEKQLGIATAAGKEAQRQLALAAEATEEARRQGQIAEAAKKEAEHQQEVARTATAEAGKQLGIAKVAKAEADRQQALAREQLERNKHLVYDSEINLAQSAYEADNLMRVSQLLDAYLPTPIAPNQADLRGFDWFYLRRLYNSEQKRQTDYVGPIEFSPKGNTLAIGGDDNSLKLWDPLTQQQAVTLKGFTAPLHSVMFSPDGRMLITGAEDGVLKLWDLSTNPPNVLRTIRDRVPETRQTPHSPIARHFIEMPAKFSRDGKTLATWDSDTVQLWDTVARQEQLTLKSNVSFEISSVDFSPDGKILIIDYKQLVEFWDVSASSPRELAMLRYENSPTVGNFAVFSPDSRTLVTEDRENSVKLWDLSANPPKERAQLEKSRWHLFSAFSPDGTRLVMVDYNGTVEVWDASAGTPWQAKIMTVDLGRNANNYPSVAFSPDGNMLAIWKGNGLIKLVSIKINEDAQLMGELATLRIPGGPDAVEFSSDSKTLAALSPDGTMKVWDLGEPDVGTLRVHASSVSDIRFSPGGETLAALSSDKSLKLWDVSSTRMSPVTYVAKYYVVCDALSPNGETLAIGGKTDGSVQMLNTDPLKDRILLKGAQGDSVHALAFSPDGKTLVGGGRGTVRLWKTNKPDEEPESLKSQRGTVMSVAFSPEGNRLAIVDDRGTVEVWETGKLEPPRKLKMDSGVLAVAFSGGGKALIIKHQNGDVSRLDIARLNEQMIIATNIRNVALSPDGKTMATVNAVGEVKLWDINSLEELRKLDLRSPDIGVVALSPDGKILATGSGDTVKLLDISTGQELVTLRVRGDWHAYPVSSLAFSYDGKILIARNRDEVTSWYAATPEHDHRARRSQTGPRAVHANRGLGEE